VDFDFSPDQIAFRDQVEKFLDENDDPIVFDVTRENMAQVADIPERRALMGKVAEQGWLGITWPKEWGGQEGDGVYEYLLNEALARRGGPQIGKGIGIIGKTILRHGSEKMQKEFLPKILRNEIDFAVGYSEPDAGSDAASMKLKATRDGDGWRLNGQKTWTTSAHFAEWYWVGARTDPEVAKHFGITLFLVPLDDRRLWYRYHHLFADVLRARLLDQRPERVDELHRRASAWYEATGDRPEAIAHAMAGRDIERAARLIELGAPVLFRTRQEATARRWLTALLSTISPIKSLSEVNTNVQQNNQTLPPSNFLFPVATGTDVFTSSAGLGQRLPRFGTTYSIGWNATHTDSNGNTSPFALAVSVPTAAPDPTPTPIGPRPPLLAPRLYVPMITL